MKCGLIKWLSVWTVIALVLSNVAQAAGVSPQPIDYPPLSALPSTPQVGNALPWEQLADEAKLQDRSASPPSEAQPGHTTSAASLGEVTPPPDPVAGRMLFAPAIDADGNPTSNPVAGTPAPVMDLLGQVRGLVMLAVQLEADRPEHIPIGIPVTFHLWNAQGERLEEVVRSDAWGAAGVELFVDDVAGEYAYQASAPGYGQTEVRRFRFDPNQAGYVVHSGGAQLWYWRQAAGQILFTLRSPVPLQAGRDQVTLVVARRPEPTQVGVEPSPLQPIFEAIQEAGASLPFPELAMRIVGDYTATLQVQLPPGQYSFLGSLAVNGAPAEHFYSQPMALAVTRQAAPPSSEARWVSALEYEPGFKLVQYRAPAGQALFGLAPTGQEPQIDDDWEGENQLVKVWRTGPFEWEEERYDVRVETLVDDGKKVVSLQDMAYDPIVRRYTLAIRSLQDVTITDTLRVDVLGPGGVVIRHEESQVVLEPGRLFHYSVEVPAELGRPEGLRVVLDDPFIGILQTITAAAQNLYGAVKSGKFTWSYSARFYAEAIGITIVQYEASLPDNPGKFEWFPNASTGKLMDDVLKWVAKSGWSFRTFTLGSAGVENSLSAGVSFTVDEGKCPDKNATPDIERALKELARVLNEEAKKHKLEPKPAIKTSPLPLWWLLMIWGEVTVEFGGQVSASDLSIKVEANGTLGSSLQVGLVIPILSWDKDMLDFTAKLYKWVRTTYSIIAIVTGASQVQGWHVPQKNCDPNPPDPGPPDDRQDVWQGIEGFYQGQTYDETIDTLHELIGRAQRQNLWRAERLLTLRLRQVELARFGSNMADLNAHVDNTNDVLIAAGSDLQGIISGTVPISPSQTMTEALIARMAQATADLEALPYTRRQQQMLDAVDVAERLYMELRGQELELQRELRQALVADAVGVLASGFAEATLSALKAAGLPAQLVSPWPSSGEFRGQPAPYFPPELAPRALVVPAGGLHAIAGSPEARDWLDSYVAGGGLLVVFTQAFGEDWAALPGGQVTGVGYEEDQRCQHSSVQAKMRSNWLTWMGIEQPDIQVDGSFTAWPEATHILLTRTRGRYAGYPAMIEYFYGEGTVLATVAYGDWAWQANFWWGDEWAMTRSVFARAYLLTHGQDVEDVAAADPASTVQVSFPLTNTSVLTANAVQIVLPSHLGHWGYNYMANVPLSLPPGQSQPITATLSTPPIYRGVHSWTQVGLYHLQVIVKAEGKNLYTTWGPFVNVRSPIIPPEVGHRLQARSQAILFETAAVTATVTNNVNVTRTVIISDQRDLPQGPVTLTVPSHGQATHVYHIVMDSSKQPAATFYTQDGQLVGRSSMSILLAYPKLQATPLVPAALHDGATLPLRVSNRGNTIALAGAVALTLTSPSGTPVWTAGQALPPLAAGGTLTPVFTLTLPSPELGDYHLDYRVDDGRGLSRASSIPLAAQLAANINLDRASYRIRESLAFTAVLRNTGRFALAPAITVSVPALSFTTTQTLTLAAGEEATLPFTTSLPTTLEAGTYEVRISAFQGTTRSWRTSFAVPGSQLEARLAAGPYRAGEALTVTLRNEGGVDTTAEHAMRLMGVAEEIASADGSTPLLAGAEVSLPLLIPGQAAADDHYALRFQAQDQKSGQARQWVWPIRVEGIAAALETRTEHPAYLASETITATGEVNATADELVSASLQLEITGAPPASPNERVNELLGADQTSSPALTVDAAGNAYAVWQDRHSSGLEDIYFAYRPVTGTWGTTERVNDDSYRWRGAPSIAVDGAGNAYAVWQDMRNGDDDIYFAYRPVTGTWSANVRVNDDAGTAAQSEPIIAVDAAGNAYAVWQDMRNGNDDIYFAYRPVTSTWGANARVDDSAGTAAQSEPSLAVDGAGNAYAAWADRRNGNNDIYFAYRPVTGTWGANERVDDDAGTAAQSQPVIAADAAGNAYAAWTDERNGNGDTDIYFAYRPVTSTWGANARVDDDPGTAAQLEPVIAVDAAGNAYAAWEDCRGNDSDIYFAYRPVTGTWEAHVRVNAADGRAWQYDPAITVNGTGTTYATWVDYSDDQDIYFARRPAGMAWGETERVSEDRYTADNLWPAVAVDTAGNAYAVWDVRRQDNRTMDIYFAYRPAGGTWGPSERVNDDAGLAGEQYNPDVAVDGAGNAYVVWDDDRDGEDIYFAYRSANGAWSPNVRVNDTPGSGSGWSTPSITVDGAGNAYAVWEDRRNGNADIYFAYRPAGGTWGANERVDDDAGTTYQYMPSIALDSAGNTYVVWDDYRNGSEDIYFAYRPAGGTWGANERVNDTLGSGDAWAPPSIAVDAAGNAYAMWDDERMGNTDIYFAYRPAGGAWGTNERVNDDAGTTRQRESVIAVDANGNAYAAWTDERDRPQASEIVFFAYRPAGGTWGANVRVRDVWVDDQWAPDITVDAAGRAYAAWIDHRTDCDIYFAILTPRAGAPLASRMISVTTAAAWPIHQSMGMLGGRTGKFYLAGTLKNQLGQILDRTSYPFYIYPEGVAVTLQTDKSVYRPGQPILVQGRVTNTAVLSAAIPLTLTAGGQMLLTRTLALEAGAGVPYSATFTAQTYTAVTVTAGPAEVIEPVAVAAPQATATLEAPGVVGRAPFSATLMVTNTGEVSATFVVNLGGLVTRTLTLASGEQALVQASLAITQDSLLTATLSGDLSLTLTQAIIQGETVALALGTGSPVRAGPVTLPYTITATGSLPAYVELQATLRGGAPFTPARPLLILPGQVHTGQLLLEMTAGENRVRLALYDASGNKMAQQEVSPWAIETLAPQQPDAHIIGVDLSPQPAQAGQALTASLRLRNDGTGGVAIAGLQIFDLAYQWGVTLTNQLTQTLTFNLDVPDDMPSGTYIGQASLDGTSTPFTLTVAGADVALALALDRPWYTPGDLVSLTATLTENAGLSGDYNLSLRYLDAEDYVTITLPAGHTLHHTFTFTATESSRASISLAYAPSEAGRRVVMIDSLAVNVIRPERGAYLISDKAFYEAGETISLTLTVTGAFGNLFVMGPMELALLGEGLLVWSPPAGEDDLGLVLTGTYPLSYTLPAQLRTGRYTFLLQIEGESYAYPVDVRGWNVTSRRITLDKPRYGRQDEISAVVEFVNHGDSPIEGLRLSAWVAPPGDADGLSLSPPLSRTVNLLPGLNVLTVTGALSTPLAGPHRLVVNVGPGCCGWRVAGASAQFDVGWTHLVELRTDKGDYLPGEAGVGILDVYGYGPTHLVVTATNGATLLDVQPELAGYQALSFTIPTTPTGDYLLLAHSRDQEGNADRLIRAYAVPGPRDTQAPTLTLSYPATDTLIVAPTPALTLTVTGHAADDNDQVTVLVNGQLVTPTASGAFSLPMAMRQGLNMVSAAALDASGNVTHTPIVPVVLAPAHNVSFSVDRTQVGLGERIAFQAVLTSSAALSDVVLSQPLASGMLAGVTVSASHGVTYVGGLDPAWHNVEWQGDLTQPATVTIEATPLATGTLTQTVVVYWGWGLTTTATVQVDVQEPTSVAITAFRQVRALELDAWLLTPALGVLLVLLHRRRTKRGGVPRTGRRRPKRSQ